jgi:hypothetical protein
MMRGGQTFERITLKDTLLGAAFYWLAMIGLRLLALIYVIAWALITGRGAGWLILAAVVLTLQSVRIHSVAPPSYEIAFDSEKYAEHRKAVSVAVFVGAALCALHLLDVWPALYWQWGDGRVWWMLPSESGALPHLVTWARFVFVAVSAWVIWTPSKLLDWTLRTEQTHPKQREMTVAQADPESLLGPDGLPYAKARKGFDGAPAVVISNKANEGGTL